MEDFTFDRENVIQFAETLCEEFERDSRRLDKAKPFEEE